MLRVYKQANTLCLQRWRQSSSYEFSWQILFLCLESDLRCGDFGSHYVCRKYKLAIFRKEKSSVFKDNSGVEIMDLITYVENKN
jgi:hypothetical protein